MRVPVVGPGAWRGGWGVVAKGGCAPRGGMVYSLELSAETFISRAEGPERCTPQRYSPLEAVLKAGRLGDGISTKSQVSPAQMLFLRGAASGEGALGYALGRDG